MNTFKIRNSSYGLPFKFLLYGFVELVAYISLSSYNKSPLYITFSSFAIYQLLTYFWAFQSQYDGDKFNMFLSYGFTRKDILIQTIRSMLTYFLIHNLFMLLMISLEFTLMNTVIILLVKFVDYILLMPLFIYMLFTKNYYLIIIRFIIGLILGNFVPNVLIDLVFALLIGIRLHKVIFIDNLV